MSDCGAISDFWRKGRHEVSESPAAAAAKGVVSGTDVECGSEYKNLPQAVKEGKISEEQIDVSVKRLLEARFELGDFDPDSLVEWTSIPESVVACPEHKALALDMAREQMVLLQNRDNTLPLKKDASRIMVMGPNAADSTMLWGIYFGQPTHTVTVLEGIRDKIGKAVPYAKACDITSINDTESLFGLLRDENGKPGMSAMFWNNIHMDGKPAYTATYTAPLAFDSGGNTVFAPGVELSDFTAQFKGTFTAVRDETIRLDFAHNNGMRFIVNGDTLSNRKRNDYVRYYKNELNVKAGESYNIQIDYTQFDENGSMSFDIIRNLSLIHI